MFSTTAKLFLEEKAIFIDSTNDLSEIGRKFFELNTNFQDIFTTYQNKNSRESEKIPPTIKCNENLLKSKQEAIQKWFKEEKLKELQTFEDVKENKKKTEKLKQKCIEDFFKSLKPWYITKKIDLEKIPFYKRFQCLPKLMMKLEFGFKNHYHAVKMMGK